MKILLVRPKFSSIVASLEPLGLEYVGAMLGRIGVQYEIWDEFVHPWAFRFGRLAKRVREGGFDCVGINANANTVDYTITTARRLKKRFPNLKVLAGGPEAELNFADFCVDGIDYVFHDNTLDSMQQVVQSGFALPALRTATGVCFKDGGGWVMQEKGPPATGFDYPPDRSELYRNIKKNFMFCKGSFAIVKGSWSCPFNCSFCYCTKMNNGVYAERCVEDLIEEVKGIDHPRIWFVDDTFLLNRQRVEQFCNRVLEEGIQKQFMAYSRADFLAENPDILPLLHKAGFRDILVGLEAVADDLLAEYNKQTSLEQNELAIKHLRQANIACNGLFVVSHKSRHKDFKALHQFIKRNRLLWVVIGIFTPYKGTDAYDEYKDQVVNFKSKRLDGLHITIKPQHMSGLVFMIRTYWLYVVTYPKIIFRAWRGTAYNTQKDGWF